ncbi:MAG TPA: multiheme c-type cytochrome [Bryobacteraceae bacterium]|nr:multiheme c-type cytochrome [Bryobacteraceae bacterium]
MIVLAVAGTALAQTANRTYVGAGGCKSSNCHGATKELPYSPPDSRIKGTEFATWSSLDKHTRAERVLGEARGKRMGEILKIDADRDKRCTVCHVVGSPDNQRTDGVSCEACHGAASQWKDSHEAKNSHTDSVKNRGMTDTRDPQIRSSLCLSCHLGSGERAVDHEMIAAGHPDLAFELNTFDFAMPAHHFQRDAKTRLQSWAVGQSNALTEAMRLLTGHAEKSWPEFSDLECYQCHHDLRKDSWRIAQGFPGRKPGTLRVNLARFEVLRVLAATAVPDQRAALESSFGRLSEAVSNRLSDGNAIASAARGVERSADELTKYFMRPDVNIDAQAMVQALAANIGRIAEGGVNAAEQATMSLDALTSALGKPQEAVTPLYDYLERPSAYTPAEFVSRFRKAAGV